MQGAWQVRDTDNFQKLVDHLIPRSHYDKSEKMDYARFIRDGLLLQWRFMYTEEEQAKCHCGQGGLENKFYIRNHVTGETTFVGSTCIKRFSEEFAAVAEIAHALYRGFSATLVKEKERHYYFRLTRSDSPLIDCDNLLRRVCGDDSPLYVENGVYHIKMVKSSDPYKQPKMYKGERYNVCGTMRVNPNHPGRMQYVFYSIKEMKAQTKGEEEYVPEEEVDEEEEEEDDEAIFEAERKRQERLGNKKRRRRDEDEEEEDEEEDDE